MFGQPRHSIPMKWKIPEMATSLKEQPDRMQCMEVWGGNQPADRYLRTTGIDLWIYSQPHGTAASGGDVYYVSSCASGRITRLLLADVSGHGDVVAGCADALRQLMRRNINYINQSALVTGINREFASASADGRFATALIGTYFAPTKTLTISNAGHPTPLIYRAETGEWQNLAASKESDAVQRHLPLGIEGDEEYSGMRTKLRQGDLVLWFTDGLTEMETPGRGLLGTDGLLSIMSEFDPRQPDQFIASLVDRVTPSDSVINAGDDISIVLLQTNEGRVSLLDNIFAPFRAAAGLIENWRGKAGK